MDGSFAEGDAVPSVRQVSSDYQINHLTVARAYQELVEAGLLEKRRGLGMFVVPGARSLLTRAEQRSSSTMSCRLSPSACWRWAWILTRSLTGCATWEIRADGQGYQRQREKHFGDQRAVDGIDLELEAGSILGLIGPQRRRENHAAEVTAGSL